MVLETNGSKLKKEDIALYKEISEKKDEDDYFKTTIEATEKLKEQSETTLKELESKIESKDLDANNETTKKTLKASKDNIAKHQTKINYLKIIQAKGLNEKIVAAAKSKEKKKDDFKTLLDSLLDDKTPKDMKEELTNELSKSGVSEEKQAFIKEAQAILQEVKTKEALDQKAYSY
ncbi:21023_t:CDS:2 [Entrophospora sp. SA101]|nr:9868_t:CDS:2 [Entrophospora sp. SA101]CAJ0746990.1 21023_t:CDS:2 [Entrophospora sp. SA101]CAJ0908595.1 13462_t:CDS:2 [Entrophospora sp. SA101]